MAQRSKPNWLAALVALTAAELATIRRYDPGLGEVDRGKAFATPASTVSFTLIPSTEPNNSTVKSMAWVAPFDCDIGEIAFACTSAAGTAATADILVGDTVAAAATVLDAPEDIKTGVPEPVVVRPEVGSETMTAGQVLLLQVIGTGVGLVVGAGATVTVKRL